jgi:hypothetical protein
MDENKEIQELITTKVAEGLAVLAPHLQSWVRDHLIEPRQVRLSIDPEGKSFNDFWLVTDHLGTNDASYRLVYNEAQQAFGLECTLDTGVEWYMGDYGSLSGTVENM